MNKRSLAVFICLVFLVFGFVGCNLKTETEPEVDPREKEIVQLMVNDKLDEAEVRAKELYKGEELEEVLGWISDWIEREENHQQSMKDQRQEMNPSTKLEIQPEYEHSIRGNYIYINGRVKNVSSANVSYFEVVVDFLDDGGNVLDSGYTNDGLNLNTGDRREFEIMHRWNDEFKQYKLSIGKVSQ